ASGCQPAGCTAIGRVPTGPFLAMRRGDMRKALLACAVLTCPLAARAQSSFVLTSPQADNLNPGSTQPQIFIGAANCRTQQLAFHWDLTNLGGVNGQVNIVKAHNSSTCGQSAPTLGTGETQSAAPSQNITGDDSVAAQNMILDPDAGLPGGCDNTTTSSVSPWSTFYCIQ